MKIIQVINSFSAGGAEILAKELSIEIKRRGMEVEIWAICRSRDKEFERKFIEELNKNNIKAIGFDKTPHKDRIKVLLKLRKVINKTKADIFHIHGEAPLFYCLLAWSLKKIPVIETIHSTLIDYPLLQRLFEYKIKAFVAISNKVKDNLTHKLKINKNKIYRIYNGISVSKFDKMMQGKQDGSIKLINIGRLTKEKDQKTLIEGFKILKERYFKGIDQIYLTIVGEGEKKKELKDLCIKYGLERSIIFAGVSNDVAKILSEADIFILSSLWEGFPLTILEAMAARIPVIATDVGSVNEIIEDKITGILIKPGSPEQIAESVYLLLNNKELRQNIIENAFNRVSKNFTIEKCAEEHINLYERILKQ